MRKILCDICNKEILEEENQAFVFPIIDDTDELMGKWVDLCPKCAKEVMKAIEKIKLDKRF